MNRAVLCRTCMVTIVAFGDHDLGDLTILHLRSIHPNKVTQLHYLEPIGQHPSMTEPVPVA